jgi:hypothetical protein
VALKHIIKPIKIFKNKRSAAKAMRNFLKFQKGDKK